VSFWKRRVTTQCCERSSLQHIPRVRAFVGRDFESGHVIEPGMPRNWKPSVGSTTRVFSRQLQTHTLIQVLRQFDLLLFCLLAGAGGENHEVVSISDREEPVCPALQSVCVPTTTPLLHHSCGEPGLSGGECPAFVLFLDDAEGHVGEQWQDHPGLWSTFLRPWKPSDRTPAFKNCAISRATLPSVTRARTRSISKW
jgi:hypothetical protein